MSADLKLQGESVRDLDPNVLQRRASNPLDSVWVSASAGTGKTKVLTDRVLRLLLPLSENESGTPAHKILCLTFTKAAASEMALRIGKVLGRWAVMPEAELAEALQKLLGRSAHGYEMSAARRLFAEVMECAGGLQIMTIHAFCQSVLGRFPLEAGLSPGFQILEESQAAALLNEAKRAVFAKAQAEVSSPLYGALNNIAQSINEDQFFQLLLDGQKEQYQLHELLEKSFGSVEGLYQKLCSALEVEPGSGDGDLLRGLCGAANSPQLENLCRVLGEGTVKTDHPKAEALRRWLDLDEAGRFVQFDLYRSVFVTKDRKVKKNLMTKKLSEKFPAEFTVMQDLAEQLIDMQDREARGRCAALTRDLVILVEAILQHYHGLKQTRGALDFDDLILKTLSLLEGRSRPDLQNMQGWVHYKLDQGLDHILIDEAQDTNPQQWKIIEALCDDFFAGIGNFDDRARTVFTVGDEKQSIYSFQRASPEEFARMRAHFARKITDGKKGWSPVDLNISFRSARAVLKAVDHVFSTEGMRRGLGLEPVNHHSFRRGQAGLVELWPLCENEEAPPSDPWEPPINIVESRTGQAVLAEKIASEIERWVKGGEILESHGRCVQPGDIMILVRTRSAFVEQVTRALKQRQIPVSGNDRMVLNDQLAVQDFLAYAEFGLMPGDDLSLACLLKSPLIGLSEEDLFQLCYGRQGSLWDSVRSSEFSDEAVYLERLIQDSRVLSPFEFFSQILRMPCPADDRSGQRAMAGRLGADALEPLEELLDGALAFESDHIPDLQNFVQWQKHSAAEVKREMEEGGQAVRIMTVHGSKGLQAPIVILPDTTRLNRHVPGQSDKRFLWPEKTGLDVPFWAPRKDLEFESFREQFDRLEARYDEEYRRLLYVAMTRAEDRLYIGGYKAKRSPIEDSWYNYVAGAMMTMDGVEELEDGSLRFSNPQIHDPDRAGGKAVAEIGDTALPDWALRSAPAEPTPPRPLVPSRPSESVPAALSPLKSSDQSRFRRGNLTHKLLQVLPDLEESTRGVAAQGYLERYAGDLEESVRAEIIQEVMDILNHPEFAPLFVSGSQAEVPVTGLVGADTLISGQIDRLRITEEAIWIVDYKTNRPPPVDARDVPKLYYDQMLSYYEALRAIYPERSIHCALLWTDGPRLMPLSF